MSEDSVLLEQESETAVTEQTPETTQTERGRICRQCNAELQEDQKFCPVCGTAYEEKVEAAPSICSNCGKEMPSDSGFCPFCGNKIVEAPVCGEPAKKKKSILPLLIGGGAVLVILIAVILAVALHKVPVDSIQLSATSIEVVEEEATNISCIVYPENATDKTVVWSSSDEKVASVDQYGRITAVGSGTCEITAASGDATATLDVIVKKKLPDLKAIYDEFCQSTWASLGNDQSYLSVDTNPYDYDDGDYRFMFDVNDAIEKINRKLGLPDSLYEDMNRTSWSMGKQEEVFENIGLKVTWTYHPDKGLEVTYKLIVN